MRTTGVQHNRRCNSKGVQLHEYLNGIQFNQARGQNEAYDFVKCWHAVYRTPDYSRQLQLQSCKRLYLPWLCHCKEAGAVQVGNASCAWMYLESNAAALQILDKQILLKILCDNFHIGMNDVIQRINIQQLRWSWPCRSNEKRSMFN